MKGRSTNSEIEVALRARPSEDRAKILANPTVVALAKEIETIRANAASLWQQGWLGGRRPGEAIDLSDLSGDPDEDS